MAPVKFWGAKHPYRCNPRLATGLKLWTQNSDKMKKLLKKISSLGMSSSTDDQINQHFCFIDEVVHVIDEERVLSATGPKSVFVWCIKAHWLVCRNLILFSRMIAFSDVTLHSKRCMRLPDLHVCNPYLSPSENAWTIEPDNKSTDCLTALLWYSSRMEPTCWCKKAS